MPGVWMDGPGFWVDVPAVLSIAFMAMGPQITTTGGA